MGFPHVHAKLIANFKTMQNRKEEEGPTLMSTGRSLTELFVAGYPGGAQHCQQQGPSKHRSVIQ